MGGRGELVDSGGGGVNLLVDDSLLEDVVLHKLVVSYD